MFSVLQAVVMGKLFCLLLFLILTIVKSFINGEIKKDFYVIELAADGIKTNPNSIATLIEHKPNIPFPDVFTFCWRSHTTFARDLWSWNYIDIPSNPEKRFLGFSQYDNGTTSVFSGRKNSFF